MKITTHVGNAVLILDGLGNRRLTRILLGRKKSKNEQDRKRKRQRIGIGCWVPPGGETQLTDRSQKHSAQREIMEETGISFPLWRFKKAGILKGYIGSSKRPDWLVHIYTVYADLAHRAFKPNDEYDEMRWFRLSELPLERMLRGDRIWLPRVAKGEKLSIKVADRRSIDTTFTVITGPLH